jgi:Flp pilus assembly pilin Flp
MDSTVAPFHRDSPLQAKGGDHCMTLRARLRLEDGQAAVEYALLLALVTALLIASIDALGISVPRLYEAVTNAMP